MNNSKNVRIYFNDDKIAFNEKDKISEIARVLIQLKQRFTKNLDATNLVDSLKIFERQRIGPIYHRTLEEFKQKGSEIFEISKISKKKTYADYQIESWERILNFENVVISAPTGFGKTDAFLPPIMYRAVKEDKLAIIIYPRVELLKDQLRKILEYAFNMKEELNREIRIAFQFGSVGSIFRHTFRIHERENVQYGETTETNLFKIVWDSYTSDSAYLKIIDTCPKCFAKNTLHLKIPYRKSSGARRKIQNLDMKRKTTLTCSKCGTQFRVSFSKEDHRNLKPHILITTIESLDNLMLNPQYREMFQRVFALVIDEVHVFHSLYGAHAANVIRRFDNLMEEITNVVNPVQKICSSATIDNPLMFAMKLFDLPEDELVVVNPSENDKQIKDTKERYFFIRGNPKSELFSTYLQTVLAVLHAILPVGERGRRVLSFFDSLDLVSRAKYQYEDADNNRGLWKFRFWNECMNSCNIDKLSTCKKYLAGECWYGLANKILNIPLKNVYRNMNVDLVSSLDRGYSKEADIVMTTSALELGVDDYSVNSIIQYKAPKSVFSFIQRKGRAGRNLSDDAFIFSVFGSDISDEYYFRRFNELIEGDYNLPLNPDNYAIKNLHKKIYDFANKINNDFVKHKNKYSQNRYYQLVLKSTWKELLNNACSDFSNFVISTLGKNFYENLIAPEIRQNYRLQIEHKKDTLRSEVTKILDRYVKTFKMGEIKDPIEILDIITKKMSKFLDKLEENQENPKLIETLKHHISELENTYESKSLDKITSQDIMDTITKCYNDINPLLTLEIKAKYKTEISEIFDDGLLLLYETLTKKRNFDLVSDSLEIKRLRYKISALEHLLKVMDKWDSAPILKGFLQAHYDFCRSCENYNSCNRREKVDTFLTDSYFEESPKLKVYLPDNRTVMISITDALFTYLPWKVQMRTTEGDSYILLPKIKKVKRTGNPEELIVYPMTEGSLALIGDNVVLSPQAIYLEKYSTDPNGQGLLKICFSCFETYSHDYTGRCRNDNEKLATVKTYSSPRITRYFEVKNIDRETKYTKLCNIESNILLEGVDVTFRIIKGGINKGTKKTFYMRYNKPFLFNLVTRGIVFQVPKFEDVSDPEFITRILSFKGADAKEIYYHTVAHIMLLLIASVSGVNPETLWYWYDTDKSTVAIWENNEGGLGIVDNFFFVLETNPMRIYRELKSIVMCPIFNAEKAFIGWINPKELDYEAYMEYERLKKNKNAPLKQKIYKCTYELLFREGIDKEFKRFEDLKEFLIESLSEEKEFKDLNQRDIEQNLPLHIGDSCPKCVMIPYCSKGNTSQWKFISTLLAEKFYNAIVKKTSDKSYVTEVIKNKEGFVVELNENDEYTILQL